MNRSTCLLCNKPFVVGDSLQAFLRSPDNSEGSWSEPVIVDSGFQARVLENRDKVPRKHTTCERGAE